MPRTLVALVLFAALAVPARALAQVNAVDPDAPARKPAPEADPADEEDTDARPAKKTGVGAVDPDAEPRKREPAAETPAPQQPKKRGGAKQPEPAPEPAKPQIAPLLVTRAGDAELEAAWDAWRRADAAKDLKNEAAERKKLAALKAELGATALEPFAMGFIRASRSHEKAGDAAGAIDLALASVELAPDLPSAHLGLARAYFVADPSEIGRWVGAFQVAMGKALNDPRWLRPMIADLGSGLLYALVATAIAVTAVLFLRRARYYLYDFHWLFPRSIARWQSATVAVLLVLMPIIFRMGVVPTLLVLFAAAALYLTVAERVVVAVSIGLLGGVPLAAAQLVNATAFAGTAAERVWAVETGGPGSEARALELTRLATENQASFVELGALGSFELRRGKLDLAIPHLRAALEKRQNEPRVTNNLAVAFLLTGDLENPKTLLPLAAKADPHFGVPLYNLSRVIQRRVVSGGEGAAGEVDEGNRVMTEAKVKDPSLANRPDPAPDKLQGNVFAIVAPLARADVLELAKVADAGERVQSQLTRTLLGDVPEVIAPFYPLVAALLLVGLGFLAVNVEAARACNKCGRPVSQREDKDLSKASQMCTQCINVFARKGVVPPSLKVRKQLEVARYQQTVSRASYIFGAVCSGMGHVFGGWPVRGTLYAFVFLFSAAMLLQPEGVLRVVYEGPPTLFKVVPLGLVGVLVWALTLRGLFRRQA